MNKVAKYLNQHIIGSVYSNESVTEAYSTDKSIMRIKPQAVAIPESTGDIRKLVRFAYQMTEKGVKTSVTPRGNGNDKTGAAIGDGVVVVVGQEMSGILEVDVRQRLVRVQPGLTIGNLNNALSLYGLKVPVEPFYKEHTIGGMIANNFAGELSAHFGKIGDYVKQLEVVLSTGDVIQTGRLSKRELNRKKGIQNIEGEIYRRLDSMLVDKGSLLTDLITEGDIDNSGYESIILVKEKDGSFDLMPLFFASQGTLGIISEVILQAEYVDDEIDYVLAEFESYDKARDAIDFVMTLDPVVLDLYDSELLALAEKYGKMIPTVDDKKEEKSKVVVLAGFNDRKKSKSKLKKISKIWTKNETRFVLSNESNYENFSKIKDIVELYMNDEKNGVRVPVMDNAYVPLNFVGEYVSQVKALAKKHMTEMPLYGSALSGVYNVRPGFDLSSLSDRQKVFKLLVDYAEIINSVEGSITGNAAEGRVKSIISKKSTNEQLLDIYAEIKDVFDPKDILNPGVKSEVSLKEMITNLRKDYDEGIIKE